MTSPQGIFLEALKRFPQNESGPVLDIGCGCGEMLVYLARQGKEVYGVDYSPHALRISREVLRFEAKRAQDIVHLRQVDCARLPFRDNFFQYVILLDIVEHLTPKQLRLTLSEVRRVLKKRGILIIHTNNKYFEKFIKPIIAASYHGWRFFLYGKAIKEKILANPYENLHINYLSGDELIRHLEKIGFDTKIEYVRPSKKQELKNYLSYGKRWKDLFLPNIAWFLLNSPFLKFISPTFWVVARKVT